MARQEPLKPRSIRAGQEWDQALEAAERRGEILSEQIRNFLTDYANKDHQ